MSYPILETEDGREFVRTSDECFGSSAEFVEGLEQAPTGISWTSR